MNVRVKDITASISNNYYMIERLGVEIINLIGVEAVATTVEVKDTLTNVIDQLEETVSKLNNEAVALTKELLEILSDEDKQEDTTPIYPPMEEVING